MAQIEKLQMENLQTMYPEYYQEQQQQVGNNTHVNPIVDEAYQPAQQQENQEDVNEGQDEGKDDKEKEYDKEYRLYKIFKNQQTQQWMKRPSRRQVKESKKDTAYIEGNYDYNIWYDKYLTDRTQHIEKAPSLFKCNPEIDTGYTKADKVEKKGSTYFCVYFARGACTEGVNCRFYHRVPQEEDLEPSYEDNLHDVFGRARHATHKEDHTGIGSFNKECRTLLVSNIQLPTDSLTPVRDMVRTIYEFFSPWGEVEDIHFNSQKCQAFIKYKHRYFAEFAREAMFDQVLAEGSTEPIAIKWAIDSPFDKSEAMRAQQEVAEQQEQMTTRVSMVSKNKKAHYLLPQKNEQDPHMLLSMEERMKLKPEELVPQIVNPAARKREQKILEKERRKMLQQKLPEISEGFEANLYQEKEGLQQRDEGRYYEGQVMDADKVVENCNKMASVLQMISQNYGSKE